MLLRRQTAPPPPLTSLRTLAVAHLVTRPRSRSPLPRSSIISAIVLYSPPSAQALRSPLIFALSCASPLSSLSLFSRLRWLLPRNLSPSAPPHAFPLLHSETPFLEQFTYTPTKNSNST